MKAQQKPSQIVAYGMANELVQKYIANGDSVLDLSSRNTKWLDTSNLAVKVDCSSDNKNDEYTFLLDLNERRNFSPTYDIITAWNVIEHLENPYEALRTVKKLLKKDGVFFFSVPNTFSLKSRLKFLFTGDMEKYREGHDHKVIFTKATMKNYLKDWIVLEAGTFKSAMYFVITPDE